MTKKEFFREIFNGLNGKIKMKDIEAVYKKGEEVVLNKLTEEERIPLPGLGNFVMVERKERQCINPQTGEMMVIPACKVPKFNISKALKNKKVNL